MTELQETIELLKKISKDAVNPEWTAGINFALTKIKHIAIIPEGNKMKNFFDLNPKKIERPVKKWDVHGCSLCPAIKPFNKKLWQCGIKNKLLDYMAAQKNVIPEWCPLEDY